LREIGPLHEGTGIGLRRGAKGARRLGRSHGRSAEGDDKYRERNEFTEHLWPAVSDGAPIRGV